MHVNDLQGFRASLLHWYRQNARDLPWRRTSEPYAIWLSEIMLQQTRVSAVIAYYKRFLEEFPSVQDLAAADLESVLKLWEGLGYYRRARLLHKAAIQVTDRHDARFPGTYEGLKTLPGIGDYTAAAIASIAFEEAVPVLDGNVKRVLARLVRFEEPINDNRNYKALRSIAEQMLDRSSPGDWNQAMMELGARICLPRQPLCEQCPIQSDCRAFLDQHISEYPKKTRKKAVPHKHGVAILQMHHNCALFVKRSESEMLSGLWEFPSQLMEEKESREEALHALTTGLKLPEPQRLQPLGTVQHQYTHFTLTLHLFVGVVTEEQPCIPPGITHRWLPLENSDELPLHRAQQKLIDILKDPQQNLKL